MLIFLRQSVFDFLSINWTRALLDAFMGFFSLLLTKIKLMDWLRDLIKVSAQIALLIQINQFGSNL